MGMNDFSIGLVAGLDGTKSKQQLNQDIEALKRQLGSVEVQAKLDNNTIANLTKQLNSVQINLQNVFIDQTAINNMVSQINTALSGININLGNALNGNVGQAAQNVGRQVGQQIQNGINQSLLRDKSKIKFEETFKQSNNAAKEAQKYFQELDILKKEGATVTVSEQYNNEELKGFIVNVKRATGEVESLNYQLRNLGDNNNPDMWFQFTGGRTNDSGAVSQMKEISKYYTDYATKLNNLKTKYSNTNLDTSGFETTLNNFKKGIGTVDELKIAFNSLENSAKLSVQSLKSQTASFDPIQQTLNNMRDVPSMLKTLAANMDNVKDKTSLAGISVSDLQKSYDVLKTEMDKNNGNVPLTQNWIEQYKILMSTITSTTKQVEALKKAEASDNSNTTKQANYYSSILSNYREIYRLKQKLVGADKEETSAINNKIRSLNGSNSAIFKQLKSQGLTDSSWQSQVDTLKTQLEYNLKIAQAHQTDKINQENVNTSQKESLQITKDLAQAYQKIQDIKIKIATLDKDVDSNTRSTLSDELTEAENSYRKLYKNSSRRKNYDKESWQETKTAIDEATKSKIEYNASKSQDSIKKQANTQLDNLNSLKSQWKEQGILVGEFEQKVNSLETRLSSVGTKGELGKLKEELHGIKVEASFLTSETQINNQLTNGTLSTQIEVLKNRFQQVGLSSDEAKGKVEKLYELLAEMKTSSGEELSKKYKEFNNVLTVTKNELSVLSSEQSKFVSETSRLSKAESWQKWLDNNTKATKKYGKEIKELIEKMKNLDEQMTKSESNDLTAKMKGIRINARNNGLLGNTTFDKLKTAWQKFGGWSIATGSLMGAVNQIKQIPKAVYEIDTAMTDLYKVTDETNSKYEDFLKNAKSTAKELGRDVSSTINQTAEWAKLGYSIDDSAELAKNSSIYSNVGEVDDSTAVSDMVTAMKAFNIEAKNSIQIVDKLNILGNEFATSSADLGTGLKNSASALALAGNDINKTLAMLTGGTEITQNASEMGNTLKVLSMRIRGMKGKLEELGEDSEGVESISKIQTQILNLTKGQVNIFDDSGNFKDTYDILEKIAKVWKEISETDQASLLEIIAGKQRGNQVAALIQSFQSGQAQKAYQESLNSAGSAQKEQDRWMESAEAKIQQLEAAWQSLSDTVLSSDFLKGTVDTGTSALGILDKITEKLGGIPTLLTAISGVLSSQNIGKYTLACILSKCCCFEYAHLTQEYNQELRRLGLVNL